MPILFNNLIIASKLQFTVTAELQNQNGKTNFIIIQMPKAKTLSPCATGYISL